MVTKLKLMGAAVLFLLLESCLGVTDYFLPTSTPPIGWGQSVAELLLNSDSFTKNWTRIGDSPAGLEYDPTINNVGRSFGQTNGGSGRVEQAIWRAYTITDAEDKYTDLLKSYQIMRTSHPRGVFVEFAPPKEIKFTSERADEYYLACGWDIWAYCRFTARYRNYVTDTRLDIKTEYQGNVSSGLTYAEAEKVIRDIDAKFSNFFNSYSTPGP